MNFYRTIEFSTPTETLTDMPLLVKIPNNAMCQRIASPNGYDVAFQDMNGNALPFDLDFYDKSEGKGAWWVKIPTLYSSGVNQIKMVYGDDSITTDQSSPSTVWSDYSVVYHLSSLSDVASRIGSQTLSDSGDTSIVTKSITESSITGRDVCFRLTGGYGGGYSLVFSSGFWQIPATCSLYFRASQPQPDRGLSSFTGWTNYGFRLGYSTVEYIAGNVTLKTETHDKNYIGYSWTAASGSAKAVKNGVIFDTSSCTLDGCRWDAPNFGMNGIDASLYALYHIEEIRLGFKDFSATRLQYEQLNMLNHAQYVNYGRELAIDGAPIWQFTPWIYKSQVI